MEKGGKLWWVTRPTRDLHDLKTALKDFAKIAKGKEWWGNRSLQKRFEKQNRAKTPNVGNYGSGGRTWAALLRMWGLWYEDGVVKITSAGEVLLSCKHEYDQIVRLIMNFQIPSAYSEHQKLERGFKIFPFRFMLKLLLDDRIKYLAEDEIALFLLQVKDPSDLEDTVSNILKFRKIRDKDGIDLKDRKDLISEHMKKYRVKPRKDTSTDVDAHWKYIKDIANTFVNNIKFLHDVVHDKSRGIILLKEGSKKSIKKILEEYEINYPFSTLYKYGEKPFQEHFGLRYDRRKASKKSTKPQTGSQKRYGRIKSAIEKIKKTKANLRGTKLIDAIQKETSYNKEDIEKIISGNPELIVAETQKLDPSFVEYYLKCARSGTDQTEFEKMTREMFTDMCFETKKYKIKKKIGSGKPEIDGLIKNETIVRAGLLECKSGAKYTFPIGDREKMKNVYIPNFLNHKEGGKTYPLDFFVYVIGNQVSGLDNFKDIIDSTKIDGAVIYAEEFVRLYDLYKQGKISKNNIWNLFKKNKHLTWKDIEDL